MTISFTVPGPLQAFARTRVNLAGKRFTPEPQRRFAYKVQIFARAATDGELVAGPVLLRIEAFFAYPVSWSEKRKSHSLWKTSKPDIDNSYKLIADALNGIVYADDAQVVRIEAEKRYGPVERVIVTIIPLHESATLETGRGVAGDAADLPHPRVAKPTNSSPRAEASGA